MQQEYLVLSADKPVGKVSVQRRGLYYSFCCRCKLTGAAGYKLIASCGENTVDLGLCVPHGAEFGVDTTIPIKRLGEGDLTFHLIPKRSKLEGKFVPVSADEPFCYIRRLQNAHLARQDGLVGILVTKDQMETDSPTGQWSEPNTSE